MKIAMLLTGSGPLVILTSHNSVTEPSLLAKLAAKGIDKFVAYDIPVDLARERYGGHFAVASHDLKETDDLRILDYNGDRAFRLFHFEELSDPVMYEAGISKAA